MFSLPVGIIMIVLTVFYAVDVKTWPLFVNVHAIMVVIFGTASVLVLSNPTKVLVNLGRALLELFRPQRSVSDLWPELEELAKNQRLSAPSKDKLIASAAGLWESGVSSDLFIAMISQKRNELEMAYVDAVQALRNLSKYPPALGMLGTVVGLVSLFSNLGASNKAGLGPALALAMTATFFGLVLANAIIMPLADRLHVHHMNQKRLLIETYQVLLLINRGESLELLDEDRTTKIAA